ncbi:MAG: hypothetical protein OXI33_12405, partial [Chloroflexota bacterium]|nr:hypothetical protein [Chloroflexota bacterium]
IHIPVCVGTDDLKRRVDHIRGVGINVYHEELLLISNLLFDGNCIQCSARAFRHSTESFGQSVKITLRQFVWKTAREGSGGTS